MFEHLSRYERLDRTIAGRPVDRLPVALWRHFHVEEVSREGLVEAMVRWQRTYDWDFVKINPRASYHVEDWGGLYEFSGQDHVSPKLIRAAVSLPDHFPLLRPLAVGGPAGRSEAPVLSDHLAAVADIRKALGPDVPLLMTVFTPMSIAGDLAGGPENLAPMIREAPAAVHEGLRIIAETFSRFVAACLKTGADGLYLATTHCATAEHFTAAEYEAFGRPYDLVVLRAAAGARFNLLHVCGERSRVRELADYPARLLSWDTAGAGNPGLAEMASRQTGKGLVGGLDRHLFPRPDGRAALLEQAAAARQAMGPRPFVLGSTCTIDTQSDPAAVRAVREFVESGRNADA